MTLPFHGPQSTTALRDLTNKRSVQTERWPRGLARQPFPIHLPDLTTTVAFGKPGTLHSPTNSEPQRWSNDNIHRAPNRFQPL